MSNPSPFQVAYQGGTNFSEAFSRVRDENAIDSILSQAVNSGDPEVLQTSISKILSQVSPERQGPAVQFLQGRLQTLAQQKQQQQAESTGRQAAKDAGYTYGAPPQVNVQEVKDRSKSQRLSQYGLGGESSESPNAFRDQNPAALPAHPNLQGNQEGREVEQSTKQTSPDAILENMSDQNLRLLTGHPDREISEPSKAILKSREDAASLEQKKNDNWTKFGIERAKKVLDRAEEIAQTLPAKKTALKMMNNAIVSENLEFWSKDNLAEITGIEAFRSPEGALFKAAAKEYLLGNISKVGARPNQWIEQQILDMLAKIGRSTEANLSVTRAFQNEADIDEEKVRLTEEIFKQLRDEGKDIGELGPMVNKQLAKYAENNQEELFNDLRAIKAISEGKSQKFHKVAPGSKVSSYMVDALLNTFGNDADKAMNEAKKLGYDIE